ncbi:MAG: basic amino acid/polyamine antiporter, family [Mycobacterium sp.]|nr:basic amino acid/polyamine antiporter, family [Mycobacterium sp.]
MLGHHVGIHRIALLRVFTTVIAFGLILYVTAFANSKAISVLGGTTALLLLAVFAMVNVAVLALRRDVQEAGGHFKAPTVLPVIGFLASLYLVTPLSGRPAQQYVLALILVAIGTVLFFITMLINRQLGIRDAGIKDPKDSGVRTGVAAVRASPAGSPTGTPDPSFRAA